MEERKEIMLILDLKETQELFDWLIYRGLSLLEAARAVSDMHVGDHLSLAILKVMNDRQRDWDERHDYTYGGVNRPD